MTQQPSLPSRSKAPPRTHPALFRSAVAAPRSPGRQRQRQSACPPSSSTGLNPAELRRSSRSAAVCNTEPDTVSRDGVVTLSDASSYSTTSGEDHMARDRKHTRSRLHSPRRVWAHQRHWHNFSCYPTLQCLLPLISLSGPAKVRLRPAVTVAGPQVPTVDNKALRRWPTGLLLRR